jgi:hypothetical protein
MSKFNRQMPHKYGRVDSSINMFSNAEPCEIILPVKDEEIIPLPCENKINSQVDIFTNKTFEFHKVSANKEVTCENPNNVEIVIIEPSKEEPVMYFEEIYDKPLVEVLAMPNPLQKKKSSERLKLAVEELILNMKKEKLKNWKD